MEEEEEEEEEADDYVSEYQALFDAKEKELPAGVEVTMDWLPNSKPSGTSKSSREEHGIEPEPTISSSSKKPKKEVLYKDSHRTLLTLCHRFILTLSLLFQLQLLLLLLLVHFCPHKRSQKEFIMLGMGCKRLFQIRIRAELREIWTIILASLCFSKDLTSSTIWWTTIMLPMEQLQRRLQ